jgi:proline dehydrogenase
VLRAILLYLSKAEWAQRLVTGWGLTRRMASRFVAGATVEDAIAAIRKLNQGGIFATLDQLGENVTNRDEALAATDDYIAVMEAIRDAGAQSSISLKLSQMGLNLDYELCLNNMRCIANRAAEFGLFLRLDMEDHPMVDDTIRIWRDLQKEGVDHVGLVFQSYLYRTEEDLREVLAEGAAIRLCKGAYAEPADVAFPAKKDVDANYDKLSAMIMDAALASGSKPSAPDGKTPAVTAIATHDPARIDFAKDYARQIGLPKEALEFQMLHGIRSDLQNQLAEEGYPVRVYVPFGTAWYPYFMRRLAERPANLWFFTVNFLRGS